MGKLPTVDEYMSFAKDLDSMSAELYRYLNFNEIEDFQKAADDTKIKFKDIPVTVSVSAA